MVYLIVSVIKMIGQDSFYGDFADDHHNKGTHSGILYNDNYINV